MGYGYGVWLTYPKHIFPTTHVGHFTVACFMEKEDAYNLYENIKKELGNKIPITIYHDLVIHFDKNYYEDDKNEICSWGFNGSCKSWKKLSTLSKDFKCNFSHEPHTSIEYASSKKDFKIKYNPKYNPNNSLEVLCNLHVVDITNKDPNKWNIVK